MHIFLTGKIQVGKTTIIRRFLNHSELTADGFMTYWEQGDGESRRLYLSKYSTESGIVERHLVARDDGEGLILSEHALSVFNVHGSAILDASGKRDVTVMDELGYLESRAVEFQNAVLQRISGNHPILGVVKPIRTKFLDMIRTHPNVIVREVTVENRESVLAWLLKAERK